MQNPFLKKMIIALTSGILAFASISVASPASATTILDAEGAIFNLYNDNGIYAEVGETHLYEEVVTIDGTTVDVLLTVDSLADGSDLDDVDESGTDGVDTFITVYCGDGCDPWDEEVSYTPADGFKGYVQYTLDFYETGTQNPVTLENFSFYVRDIDTYQYIEVLDPDAYIVDAETNLEAVYPEQNPEVGEGNVRFQELNGLDSDSDWQTHWVEIKFDSVSSLTYKVGQDIPGGAFFSVRFFPVTFDNPVLHEAVYAPAVPVKIFKKVYFDGDSAYLKPIWFKRLDRLIASVPTCATDVTAKIISGVKKAKSEVKGSDLAQRRAAIVKKFLTKRGLNTTVTLLPNGKGVKAKNNQRFAKIVVTYNGANCN